MAAAKTADAGNEDHVDNLSYGVGIAGSVVMGGGLVNALTGDAIAKAGDSLMQIGSQYNVAGHHPAGIAAILFTGAATALTIYAIGKRAGPRIRNFFGLKAG